MLPFSSPQNKEKHMDPQKINMTVLAQIVRQIFKILLEF